MSENVSQAVDFMVRPPGGPGEAPSLDCPIAGCWWEYEIKHAADLGELLDLAIGHLDAYHSRPCDHDNLTPEECPVCHD